MLRIEDSGAATWTITEIKFSIKFRKVFWQISWMLGSAGLRGMEVID